MAYVQIPKDLSKIKSKVAFNLTKRQLIGFILAGLFGIPTYLYTKKFFGNDIAIMIMIFVAFPFFFVTLYEKDGLSCEKYFKCIYLHKFYQPQVRISKEKFDKIRREELSGKNKKR